MNADSALPLLPLTVCSCSSCISVCWTHFIFYVQVEKEDLTACTPVTPGALKHDLCLKHDFFFFFLPFKWQNVSNCTTVGLNKVLAEDRVSSCFIRAASCWSGSLLPGRDHRLPNIDSKPPRSHAARSSWRGLSTPFTGLELVQTLGSVPRGASSNLLSGIDKQTNRTLWNKERGDKNQGMRWPKEQTPTTLYFLNTTL